ncbi:MAG: hypothetical protein MJY82_06780 [Fibrobacter sp.]|nr:hypothetical protein [Fibrobacter sp.]
MNQLAGGLARVSGGYELSLFGMEGRGLYAGGTVDGLHGEWSHRDGAGWGFEERVYYKLRNDGLDPKTKKPRKYVGLSVLTLGAFADVLVYDHGNRNDNPIQKELMGKDRDAFESIAKEKGMKSGHYSALGAALHEPNPVSFIWEFFSGLFTGNFLKSTVDKMWMQDGDMHWWQVPAVEGLFTKDGRYYSAPSYNYGNNWVSHLIIDWGGWKGRGY